MKVVVLLIRSHIGSLVASCVLVNEQNEKISPMLTSMEQDLKHRAKYQLAFSLICTLFPSTATTNNSESWQIPLFLALLFYNSQILDLWQREANIASDVTRIELPRVLIENFIFSSSSIVAPTITPLAFMIP